MKPPALDVFQPVADALLRTGLVKDPWFEGVPRFGTEPVRLDRARLGRLHEAAACVARLHDEAAWLMHQRPELLPFLQLTPVQELLWRASAPRWHGYARADVFELADGGLAVCELNSDTPTGQAEALALPRALGTPPDRDPNAALEGRMIALITATGARLAPTLPRTAALIYATEMTEDLGVVLLFQRWLEAAGYRVVVGSPFNLGIDAEGQPTLLGEPFSLVFRHYKSDWWTERLPVWADQEPFDDSAPLARELHILLQAEADGRIAMLNPFGAVLTQNKRLLALFWERMDLFSPASQADIQAYIPESVRVEALHPEQLIAERDLWVLKSDYGCEGEEVVIGRWCTEVEWAAAVQLALPGRWIAQRRFVPAPLPGAPADGGAHVNFGVYVIAGAPIGCYGRVQSMVTDTSSMTVPVLLEPDDG